jgi:hypothetical protein
MAYQRRRNFGAPRADESTEAQGQIQRIKFSSPEEEHAVGRLRLFVGGFAFDTDGTPYEISVNGCLNYHTGMFFAFADRWGELWTRLVRDDEKAVRKPDNQRMTWEDFKAQATPEQLKQISELKTTATGKSIVKVLAKAGSVPAVEVLPGRDLAVANDFEEVPF